MTSITLHIITYCYTLIHLHIKIQLGIIKVLPSHFLSHSIKGQHPIMCHIFNSCSMPDTVYTTHLSNSQTHNIKLVEITNFACKFTSLSLWVRIWVYDLQEGCIVCCDEHSSPGCPHKLSSSENIIPICLVPGHILTACVGNCATGAQLVEIEEPATAWAVHMLNCFMLL